MTADDPLIVLSKRKAQDSDAASSSVFPSSPPTASSKTKQTRTNKLQEQHQARLDKLVLTGDFQKQLMGQWQCRAKECINEGSYCFIDPEDAKLHYNLTSPAMSSWATAIERGEATVIQPPLKLYLYWLKEQGAVERGSKALLQKASNKKRNKVF